MENFIFQNPTKIIFGKDTELQTGKEIKQYLENSKKVLLHYGGGSIKKSGLYDKIIKSLDDEGIGYSELGGVVPNPRLDLVREGIDICRKEKIGFLLAVGGGSVIDSAKAIAAGVHYEGDVWDFFNGKTPKKAVPIGVVLTIPAAGSESSPNSVVTDEKTGRKLPMRGASVVYPKFAIMNPELTFTLPDYQTACGLSDMLAHVMERYFSGVKGFDFVDSLSEATMRSIIKYGRLVLKEPKNYSYRAEVMWAGTVAHNGLLNTGSIAGDWSSHGIEHELSARYDIAHGAGLAIIFPAWMKFVYKNDISRFVQFGREVFGIGSGLSDEEITLKAIEELELFFKDIGMPVRLKDIDVDDEHIEEMAELLVPEGTIGSFAKLDKKAVVDIFRLAL